MAESDVEQSAARLVPSRGEDEVVEWEPLMRGVFVLWVCAYWMSTVFGESHAIQDLVDFLRHYWYWVLGVIFVGLVLCVVRRQQAFDSTPPLTAEEIRTRLEHEESRMQWMKLKFELCRRMAVRWTASVKYSMVGIFLLDRCLKTADVVSDYLVIFCRAEWPICPNDGLWWGEDWWWARFALFFTLNTVVVVWVVTAPIWVQQMNSSLNLPTWFSLTLWGVFGIPTVVVLDFVMLFAFPFRDPENHWLTTIFILQKVAEAILEAPLQALLQGWIFCESGWIENRLGDHIPIPWMLIISAGTSAFTCLMIVADINRQAEARELGLRQCLRNLALVGLERRPLQLHMLCWRKQVSYARMGPLTDEECEKIAKVARHCPSLGELTFEDENDLSIEAACMLLAADLRSLKISSRDFQLTYDDDKSLSLSLNMPGQVEDAKHLIGALDSLQQVEITGHLRTGRAENAVQADKLAVFIYICLVLKYAFGIAEVLDISSSDLVDLRFSVTTARGASPAYYDGEEQFLHVNLVEVTDAILPRLLRLLPYCGLELVSTGPFTDEQLDHIVAALPADGSENRRFIKECSVLEAIFNDRHRPQVRLTQQVLHKRQYGVQDRAFYHQEKRYLLIRHIETGSDGERQLQQLQELHRLLAIDFDLPHPFTREECEQIPGFLDHLDDVDPGFVEASATLVRTVDGLQGFRATWSRLTNLTVFEAQNVELNWLTRHLTFLSIDAIQPQAWDGLRAISSLRTLEVRTSSNDHFALRGSGEMSLLIQNLRDLISFQIPGLIHLDYGGCAIADFDPAPFIQSCLVLKATCNHRKPTSLRGVQLKEILERRCFLLAGIGAYDWTGQHSLTITSGNGIGETNGCQCIQTLRALPTLDIGRENGVGAQGCEQVGAMRHLQTLKLGAANNIGPAGCQHLRALTNLQHLELGDGNEVGSKGCMHISCLGELRRLKIGGENEILPPGCEHLQALRNLEHLEIGHRNNIGAEGCRHLATGLCDSLLQLKIGGMNDIASTGCQHLMRLRRLQHLDIGDGNDVGDQGCAHLKLLRETLQCLRLGDTNGIGAQGCAYINDLRALEELKIGGGNGIGARGCQALTPLFLTRLKRLVIGKRNQIDEAACGFLAGLRTLEHLEIGSRNPISVGGCQNLQHLAELQELIIGGRTDIKKEGCRSLGRLMRLQRLTIGKYNNIMSTGCQYLMWLQALQQLEIGDNNQIGYEGCAHLRALRNLRRLEIGEANRISNDGCRYLAEMQNLFWIHIKGNNGINAEGVQTLCQLPNLEHAPVVEGLS